MRNGAVIDEKCENERVQGVRHFMNLLREESRIDSSAIQTVGHRGYDGFVLAVVK